MLRLAQGSLFDSCAEALVCPVNTVGVMGAGLAKAFHLRWPLLLAPYKRACASGDLRIGECWTYQLPSGEPTGVSYVICLATKTDWQRESRIEYVEDGLSSLRDTIQYLSLRSIAIPALGAGLGGLSWDLVRQAIWTALQPLHDVEILVYPPR